MQTVLSWVLFPWVWKAFSPNVQITFFCRKVNFPATKRSGLCVITFLIIYAIKGTFLLFIRSCKKKLPSSFSVQAWDLLSFFFFHPYTLPALFGMMLVSVVKEVGGVWCHWTYLNHVHSTEVTSLLVLTGLNSMSIYVQTSCLRPRRDEEHKALYSCQ